MTTRFPALLLCCLFAAAGALHAQDDARPAAAALPAWEQLDPAQREALIAPVRERWNNEPEARQRMLRHAERWQQMTPGQRESARRGMKRWENMPPERRHEARVLFRHMRELPEAERTALRERWQTMTPEQRRQWLETHRSDAD